MNKIEFAFSNNVGEFLKMLYTNSFLNEENIFYLFLFYYFSLLIKNIRN